MTASWFNHGWVFASLLWMCKTGKPKHLRMSFCTSIYQLQSQDLIALCGIVPATHVQRWKFTFHLIEEVHDQRCSSPVNLQVSVRHFSSAWQILKLPEFPSAHSELPVATKFLWSFSLACDADFSTIIQILGNGFLVLLSQDLHQTVPDIMSGESKWEALGSGIVSPYHCCCVPQRSGQVSRDIILPTMSWRWSKPFSSKQSLNSVADVVLLHMQFMFVHLPKKW